MGCSTRLFEKEGWSYHDIRDRTPHFMEISRHQSDVGFNIVCADITINYSSNEGKTHWCGHTDLYFPVLKPSLWNMCSGFKRY